MQRVLRPFKWLAAGLRAYRDLHVLAFAPDIAGLGLRMLQQGSEAKRQWGVRKAGAERPMR